MARTTLPSLFDTTLPFSNTTPKTSQWEENCDWEITFLKAIGELEDVDIEGYEHRQMAIPNEIELVEILQAAAIAIDILEHERKHLRALRLIKPQIVDKINFYNHLQTIKTITT